MRNVVFGFEHLEHRYRALTQLEPPSIPVEVRYNLNDLLKDRYGDDYVADPRMASLMNLNGGKIQGFLSGKEESDAFYAKDFIRMNTSTIAKVGFFGFVVSSTIQGKLKTEGRALANRVDKLLESRRARVVATASACVGIIVGLIQGWLWISQALA